MMISAQQFHPNKIMISPDSMEQAPLSPVAAEAMLVGLEAARVSRMLDAGEFLGWQEDGKGGRFELWVLRKPLGGHPKGSTISRAALERLLNLPKYGSLTLKPGDAEDFAAVESPALKPLPSDVAAEAKPEGRLLPDGRTNFHE